MSDSRPGPERIQQQFTVTDGTESIVVRRFRSKRGERAEIECGTEKTKLDALILESISWQRSREDLAGVLDDGDAVFADETTLSGGHVVEDSPTIQISNEYTQVRLRHVRTEAGEALQVRTPSRASETNLGVSSLRAMAAQTDTVVFSVFFETPVGPEDTPIEGPH